MAVFLQSEVLKDAEYSYATDIPGTSQLQTVEVSFQLHRIV